MKSYHNLKKKKKTCKKIMSWYFVCVTEGKQLINVTNNKKKIEFTFI
jgi:phage-related protein